VYKPLKAAFPNMKNMTIIFTGFLLRDIFVGCSLSTDRKLGEGALSIDY